MQNSYLGNNYIYLPSEILYRGRNFSLLNYILKITETSRQEVRQQIQCKWFTIRVVKNTATQMVTNYKNHNVFPDNGNNNTKLKREKKHFEHG